MLRLIITITLLSSLLSTISCEENDAIGSDPSDLTLDVVISEDGSGSISVQANAINTTQFSFHSGELDSDTIYSLNGGFQYTYEITGLYEIDVRAFGNDGRYLKKDKVIFIQVGEATGPIDGENGYETPLTYEGMKLIWQDEFSGTSLNTSNWNYETGTGSSGWGNNELQYYKQENTTVSDGFLTIEAKRENFSGSAYTSSRLTTQNKFTVQYGRVDIRAQMPEGQGIWPALWMLGENITTVGWPRCGEIDIMEMIGGGDGRDNEVHGTIHWDNNGERALFGGSRKLLSGNLSDRFHVYSIIWDANSIKWYIDDIQYHGADISPAGLSEFRNKFFFIMNIAVGGNWPGSPNATTLFPQKMNVDYLRVFQPE
ncbi:MAG: beta-glucanase (GH16 family) [Cyclobacteriaceae bacterium]|jgi:beta-glucanase (GH16 family)